MFVRVHGRNMPLSEALVRFIQERFETALGRRQPQVRAICVHVEDINGPRGGVDKRCLAEITLERRGRIVVDAREPDLYRAVQCAAKRARTSVSHTIDRRRSARQP